MAAGEDFISTFVIDTSLNENESLNQLQILRKKLSNTSIKIETFDESALESLELLFKNTNNVDVKFELLWIFTNLCLNSGNVLALSKHNMIPLFINCINDTNNNVSSQSLWLLSNISADSKEFQKQLIASDCLDNLSSALDAHNKQKAYISEACSLIENITVDLKHLGVDSDKLDTMFDICASLCKSYKTLDTEIFGSLLHSIFNTINCQESLDSEITTENVDAFLEAIDMGEKPKHWAIKIIGNLISGSNNDAINYLMVRGFINILYNLVKDQAATNQQKKEYCWIISNLAAGTENQYNPLFNNNELIDHLNNMFWESELAIKNEITFVFANLISSKKNFIEPLFQKDVLKIFIIMCLHGSPKIKKECITTLILSMKHLKSLNANLSELYKHMRQENVIEALKSSADVYEEETEELHSLIEE